MTEAHNPEKDATLATVGERIPGCIQVGHYGAHEATPHCLVIDGQGRCRTPAAPRVERIRAVLDAHQFNGGGPGLAASCYAEDCEWTHPWDRPTHEMWSAHRAHVAEQITRVIPPAKTEAIA